QGKTLVTDANNPLAAAGVSLSATDPTVQLGGTVGLSIADVVYASATVSVARSVVSGVVLGSETLQGDLLSVAITNANLFIGSGAALDLTTGAVTLPAADSTTAVGFSVASASMKLGIFTARQVLSNSAYGDLSPVRKYTGLTSTLGKAQLQGVNAVKMIGTGLSLSLNRVSLGTGVLDWYQGKTSATDPTNPLAPAALALTATDPTFKIGGNVGLSIGDVVFGDASINVSRTPVTGVDDPDDSGTQVLAGDLMVVSIDQANLFLGTGASIDLVPTSTDFGKVTLPDPNDATAVGFRVSGASMSLGIFTARQRAASASATYQTVPVTKYTGLQSELGQAQLMGVSAFTLIARNLVFQLNSTSVTNGGVLNWNQDPVASANISLEPTDPTFRIGGSVGFRVADVVFGNATLNMTRRTVTGVVDPDAATKRLSGELLGLNISAATLFIGTGASLDVVSTSNTYGLVTLPPVNDPSAVGFRVENGALDLAVFTASKESTDGTIYTGLNPAKKFTGFEGDLGAAQLQGVDAVKLIGTGLYLKLNRTSVTNGAVLNWTQTPLLSSNVALGPNDPTFQIGGTVALSIADLVFGRATVDVRRTQVSGVNYRTSTGSTELLQGELLGIAITNATLFIGTGASLNSTNGTLTLPEPTDTSAVGFSVTGGSLDLGVFTARSRSTNGGTSYSTLLTPRKYTGLEGALGTARLQGVDAFKLTGTSLYLKLNQTSVSGAAVLDWKQTAVTTNVLASAGVDLGPTDPTFQIGGSVGLSIADVVFGRATVSVSRSVLAGVDDPTVADSAAVLKGEMLSVAVTGATLFIGTGATFDAGSGAVSLPASSDANAVGFSVTGGAFNLGVFTAREASVNGTTYTALGTAQAPIRKYTGLAGSLGKAQLQGVDAVKVIGTGLVLQLNSASVGGAVLDWTQPLLTGSKVGLSPTDPEFRIGGSIGLSIADVVLGNATLNLSRSTVSGVTVTDNGVVKTLRGDLLAFEINEAQLFIGSGATLNVDEASAAFGTATLPGSTDPVAVGFSVSGGDLSLGIFTAQAELTGNAYTALTGVRKYTGLQASLGKAQMQGVDAVKLISTNLVFQLNKTSVAQGGVLDWTQSSVASAGVV
ncbi:MAG: beta strand repeat-containing protein, partial [Verrucomicrobiota bacterium]